MARMAPRAVNRLLPTAPCPAVASILILVRLPRPALASFLRRPSRGPAVGPATGVSGGLAQLLLDPQKLVVFRRSLAPGKGAGLDLARIGGNREVGDGGVLG